MLSLASIACCTRIVDGSVELGVQYDLVKINLLLPDRTMEEHQKY